MSKNVNEPLLAENPNRYVMFPLQDQDIWQLYKKMFDCMWRAEEIDLSKDMKHWESLNDDERHFIKMILAFFAASDGIVVENLGARFLTEVQLPEARTAYGFQLMMENVHSETYSLLIDTYIKDQSEKTRLFQALDNFPCIKRKAIGLLNGLMTIALPLLLGLLHSHALKVSFFPVHFVVYTG